MPDHTDDIDALLGTLWLDKQDKYHAALTSLIAERDALKRRVMELESQEFTLPNDPFRDADRELRERLVCAIWPEILRQWREYTGAIDPQYTIPIDPRGNARSDALIEADKMVAAMRKGDSDGK